MLSCLGLEGFIEGTAVDRLVMRLFGRRLPPRLGPALGFVRLFRQRWHADHIPMLAGHLAYVTLLSLVPLVAVGFSILAYFPLFEPLRQQIEAFVFANFVPAAGEVIRAHFSRFVANATHMTSIGVAALAVLALLLIRAIDEDLNHIWRSRGQRSRLMTLGIYWLVLSLGPLLLAASILATSYVISLRLFQLEFVSALWTRLLGLLPFVLSLGSIILLYLAVPNARVRFQDALVGAGLAALLFEGAKKGFAFYVTHFTTYQAIYGALAVIPILFVWVYLSWFLVLFGAEVTATLGVYRQQQTGPQWD